MINKKFTGCSNTPGVRTEPSATPSRLLSISPFLTKVLRKILKCRPPNDPTRWTQRLAPSLSDPHVPIKNNRERSFFRPPHNKKNLSQEVPRFHTFLNDRSDGLDRPPSSGPRPPSARNRPPPRRAISSFDPCPGSKRKSERRKNAKSPEDLALPFSSVKLQHPCVISIHPPPRVLRRLPHRFLGFRRLLHHHRTSTNRAVCSPPEPDDMGYSDAASPASAAAARDAKKKRVSGPVACRGGVILDSIRGWCFFASIGLDSSAC
jgi:hypothetical protein